METYERLLKLRKKWQSKIEKLKDRLENPDITFDYLPEKDRHLAMLFNKTHTEGEISAYENLIGDIEHYYGFEMDMLERELNAREKAGDDGAWEKFMGV